MWRTEIGSEGDIIREAHTHPGHPHGSQHPLSPLLWQPHHPCNSRGSNRPIGLHSLTTIVVRINQALSGNWSEKSKHSGDIGLNSKDIILKSSPRTRSEQSCHAGVTHSLVTFKKDANCWRLFLTSVGPVLTSVWGYFDLNGAGFAINKAGFDLSGTGGYGGRCCERDVACPLASYRTSPHHCPNGGA